MDWNVYPAPAKIRLLFKDSVLPFKGTKKLGRNFDLRDKVKKYHKIISQLSPLGAGIAQSV